MTIKLKKKKTIRVEHNNHKDHCFPDKDIDHHRKRVFSFFTSHNQVQIDWSKNNNTSIFFIPHILNIIDDFWQRGMVYPVCQSSAVAKKRKPTDDKANCDLHFQNLLKSASILLALCRNFYSGARARDKKKHFTGMNRQQLAVKR